MKIAILGFGDRGHLYADLFTKYGAEIVAVCDKSANKLNEAKNIYGLKDEMCFTDENLFFSCGRLADLLVISTLDQTHYDNAMKAMAVKYDILLEKPITTTIEKCINIAKSAKKNGIKIYLCYVLRYAPFFIKIKELIDSGEFGKLATVNLTECVAYWHQAHSFVRGNWRNSKESSPMIVAKCCHDLDILYWLVNSKPEYISSMGSLMFFNRENAPKDSADYCFECKIANSCPYENAKFYCNPEKTWWLRKTGYYSGDDGDTEKIKKVLSDKTVPYSRCVFKCDNDVVDHQITDISFESGATAHLTMTAFTNNCYRKIHVHCTYGDLYGDLEQNIIYCNKFGGESYTINTSGDGNIEGHGGGDPRMIENIVQCYADGKTVEQNGIDGAMASHYLAFYAEKSRLKHGRLINLKHKIK